MRRKLLLCSLLGFSLPALAEVSVQAQVSPIGVGMELGYRQSDLWGVRLGYLRGDLDVDFEAEDSNGFAGDELQYDSDVSLKNSYLFADWYPWREHFRLSAGLLFNDSEATIVTHCDAQSPIPGTESCEFGNSRFSPVILGEITTHIGFDDVAPFVGMGWGFTSEVGFLFQLDLGLAYLGAADVSMSSSGSCNSNDQCRQQIKQEENEIREELDDYKVLPLVNVSVGYLF